MANASNDKERVPRPLRIIRDGDAPAAERARAVINAWGERPSPAMNLAIGEGEDLVYFRQGQKLFRRLRGGWEVWALDDYVAAVAAGLPAGEWHPVARDADGFRIAEGALIEALQAHLAAGGLDAVLESLDGSIPFETITKDEFERAAPRFDIAWRREGPFGRTYLLSLRNLRDVGHWFLLDHQPPDGLSPIRLAFE